MYRVVLTSDDLRDIEGGFTINAIDENGDEHVLDPEALSESIESLASGETVSHGDLQLIPPDREHTGPTHSTEPQNGARFI